VSTPLLVASLRDLLHNDAEPPQDLVVPASGDEIALALAALVPEARERQRRAGIPEAVTLATLRDVGRKHRLYGAETVLPWLLGILRGDVVEVGRLQVERRRGPHGHALHVPESGPLSPKLVEGSLILAAAITSADTFSCTSWLLSPLIGAAMPTSNIAAFAARFRIADPGEATAEASAEVAKFVFRRSLADVLDPSLVVPQSTLEQLVVSTLRAGDHWTAPLGITTMPSS
jgi:hypothetical protein